MLLRYVYLGLIFFVACLVTVVSGNNKLILDDKSLFSWRLFRRSFILSIVVMAVITTVPEPNLWNEICKGLLPKPSRFVKLIFSFLIFTIN